MIPEVGGYTGPVRSPDGAARNAGTPSRILLRSIRATAHSARVSQNQKHHSNYRNRRLTFAQIRTIPVPSPCRHEGRCASSRNVVRVAMGRCRRQVILSPDETPAADGEVVWSWRRDPGATSVEAIPPATGARKAASPGRARNKPSNHCAGKVGMSWLYLSNPCASSTTPLHTVLRVPPAPDLPCALHSRGSKRNSKAQAKIAP